MAQRSATPARGESEDQNLKGAAETAVDKRQAPFPFVRGTSSAQERAINEARAMLDGAVALFTATEDTFFGFNANRRQMRPDLFMWSRRTIAKARDNVIEAKRILDEAATADGGDGC